MTFAKIENGAVAKYPYTVAELRADNPATSFPSEIDASKLADFGLVEVTATEPPEITADQVLEEGSPVLSEGEWIQQWTVRDRTADEIAALEEMLLRQIDHDAGQFRLRFITDVPGQAQTYTEKEAEALAYQNNPDGSYPIIEAEAAASGMSVADVAAIVISTAAQWRVLGAAIEGQRMGAKRAVQAAETYSGKLAAAEVDWEALLD